MSTEVTDCREYSLISFCDLPTVPTVVKLVAFFSSGFQCMLVCFVTGSYLCLSLVTRNPVFGVYDQGGLKLVCSATETSLSLEISDIETI